MIPKYLLFIAIFVSCATKSSINIEPAREIFNYKDLSGEFTLVRERKVQKNKVISRQSLYSVESVNKVVEQTISVSQLGSIKGIRSIRPITAQHSIWLEKQEYFSQQKTDLKNKQLEVIMKSPEKKWNAITREKFPSATRFCYFSQVPECAKFYGFLNNKNQYKKNGLYIIWDSYPYQVEQYQGMPEEVFLAANFSFKDEVGNRKRYTLEIGGQSLFYHFDDENRLVEFYWIAQGVSMRRQKR